MKKIIMLALVVSPFIGWVPTTYADNGLVGYWKFNEGSGTNVADSSLSNNDGALVGSGVSFSNVEVAPISATNPFSLHFDGTGGTGVHVPDDDSLDMATGITALAWIYWDGSSGDNVVFDKSDHDGGDTPNYRLILKEDGRLALWNGSAAGYSSSTVSPNEWTLVNFTIDTTTTQFFINGEAAGTASLGLGAPTNYDLLIGRDAIGRYFHGYIDQVLIYNRVLTAEEIGSISDGDTPPGSGSENSGGSNGSTRTGTTALGRYKNLMDQGKVAEAQQLRNDFPAQFPASLVPELPVSSPRCIISSDLKKGSHGEDVKCLQTILGGLEIDGQFGSKTKAAVIFFQINNSPLTTDGIVGPLTRARLK